MTILIFWNKFTANSKRERHHDWILHIQISLGTKFQLKLEILTQFVQKGYFRSKTENIEHHHGIMYIQISPQSFP